MESPLAAHAGVDRDATACRDVDGQPGALCGSSVNNNIGKSACMAIYTYLYDLDLQNDVPPSWVTILRVMLTVPSFY